LVALVAGEDLPERRHGLQVIGLDVERLAVELDRLWWL
jgi:hypothetical protein